MTTKIVNSKPAEQSKKERVKITFLCRFCGRKRPLDDMKVLDRFFPPLPACSDCERKLR